MSKFLLTDQTTASAKKEEGEVPLIEEIDEIKPKFLQFEFDLDQVRQKTPI